MEAARHHSVIYGLRSEKDRGRFGYRDVEWTGTKCKPKCITDLSGIDGDHARRLWCGVRDATTVLAAGVEHADLVEGAEGGEEVGGGRKVHELSAVERVEAMYDVAVYDERLAFT